MSRIRSLYCTCLKNTLKASLFRHGGQLNLVSIWKGTESRRQCHFRSMELRKNQLGLSLFLSLSLSLSLIPSSLVPNPITFIRIQMQKREREKGRKGANCNPSGFARGMNDECANAYNKKSPGDNCESHSSKGKERSFFGPNQCVFHICAACTEKTICSLDRLTKPAIGSNCTKKGQLFSPIPVLRFAF